MHEELSRRIRFAFYLLLAALEIHAQLAGWRVSIYMEADRLSSNIIRCVLQNSRAMLWTGAVDSLKLIEMDSQEERLENMMGWDMFFHPDLIWATSLNDKMRGYTFFV